MYERMIELATPENDYTCRADGTLPTRHLPQEGTARRAASMIHAAAWT
jgi:hypothetical protein